MKWKRVDENQRAIVKRFREYGASVQSLAGVGQGCPDLLVGWHGRNYLIEIKNPDQAPSKRRLTNLERQWIAGWRGRVFVLFKPEHVDLFFNALWEI